jgi:hypothetical protein
MTNPSQSEEERKAMELAEWREERERHGDTNI